MQFAMGGLFPSSTLLKMIEEIAAEDDVKLQNGFQAYDSCSKKSTQKQIHNRNIDKILETHPAILCCRKRRRVRNSS
jgi:hypothetical protein